MKINVGITEKKQEVLFVTDEQGNNLGEIEISKEAYEILYKEFDKEEE